MELLRDRRTEFQDAGVRPYAISRDSTYTQTAWSQALDLDEIRFLSDWNADAVRGFGVAHDFRGMTEVADRTTFLVERGGTGPRRMASRSRRGARLRRAARGRAGVVALACALYLGAGLIATWPGARHLDTSFMAEGLPAFGEAAPGDHLQTGYNLWLVGHQLEHGWAPWRDPYSFQPDGRATVEPRRLALRLRVLAARARARDRPRLERVRAARLPRRRRICRALATANSGCGAARHSRAVSRSRSLPTSRRSGARGTCSRGRRCCCRSRSSRSSGQGVARVGGSCSPARRSPRSRSSGQLHLSLAAIPFFCGYALVRLRWAALLSAPAIAAGLVAYLLAVRDTTGASGRQFRQVERYSARCLRRSSRGTLTISSASSTSAGPSSSWRSPGSSCSCFGGASAWPRCSAWAPSCRHSSPSGRTCPGTTRSGGTSPAFTTRVFRSG